MLQCFITWFVDMPSQVLSTAIFRFYPAETINTVRVWMAQQQSQILQQLIASAEFEIKLRETKQIL